jgi:hypothetical protein
MVKGAKRLHLGCFDNRGWLRYPWLTFGMRRARPATHFLVNIGGRRIVYCYIRKNGCSAFKRLIVDSSPQETKPTVGAERMGFCLQHHSARYPKDFVAADHIIFVYRDPLERVVSLFKDKFVAQSGAADIFKNYLEVTGQAPEDATFSDFVDRYLGHNWTRLDSHVLPQRRHLAPVIYTDAIPLRKLHVGMSRVVGAEVADAYFKKPSNSTPRLILDDVKDASDLSAGYLRARFRACGAMPDGGAFLKGKHRQRLEALYREDRMFGDLSALT